MIIELLSLTSTTDSATVPIAMRKSYETTASSTNWNLKSCMQISRRKQRKQKQPSKNVPEISGRHGLKKYGLNTVRTISSRHIMLTIKQKQYSIGLSKERALRDSAESKSSLEHISAHSYEWRKRISSPMPRRIIFLSDTMKLMMIHLSLEISFVTR